MASTASSSKTAIWEDFIDIFYAPSQVFRRREQGSAVIPIGAFTSMVHTVSGIVLHRLQRMGNSGDAPAEGARPAD